MEKRIDTKPDNRFRILMFGLLGLNLALTCMVFYFQIQQSPKLVYVDALKLVSNYKGTEQAKREIELKSEAWNANLDTLRQEFELAIVDYEKNKNLFSARERDLTEELLKTKQEQYLNYQEVVKNAVQKADQEISSKILSKVNDYIKRYGEQQGYTVILAATQYGNIAYGDKSVDVTSEILEGLNKEFQVFSK